MDRQSIESPHQDSHREINFNTIETDMPLGKKKSKEKQKMIDSNNDINNTKKNYPCLKNFVDKIKSKYLISILILLLIISIIIIGFMVSHIKKLEKKVNEFNQNKIIKNKQNININKIEKDNNPKILIGIYFGSSISGYYIIKDNDINSSNSSSFPSELILDKDSKRGLLYGDKALKISKNKFIAEKKLYFSNFKKYLSPNKNGNYNILVKSTYPGNEEVPLKTIITQYFMLIKEDIFENYDFTLKETKWIFTVPGLWDEKGKQFMKNIIDKIDILDSEIILEQEAASLNVFYEFYKDSKYKKYFKQNYTFLLVDLGHTSIDICVNKILDDNFNLKQLLPPNSFGFGSNIINDKIIEVIVSVYQSKDKLNKYIKEDFDSWKITLNDIENIKIGINENINNNVGISIPFNKHNSKFIGKDIWSGNYKDHKIFYDKNYIYIPSNIIKSFISDTVTEIIDKLDNIINRIGIINEKIDLIILTGEFSSSKILQNKLNERFKKSHGILFSKSPIGSIAKGAAIFGLMPDKIAYRVSPVTINIEIYEKKDGECLNQIINDDNEILCSVNKTFIRMGETIKNNDIVSYKINPWDRKKIKLNIYSTFEKVLSSNNGKKIGEIEYELNKSNSLLKNIDIEVSMKFSNYISVSIKDSNNNYKSYILYYP